jgi:hypothetical protein
MGVLFLADGGCRWLWLASGNARPFYWSSYQRGNELIIVTSDSNFRSGSDSSTTNANSDSHTNSGPDANSDTDTHANPTSTPESHPNAARSGGA